MKLNSDKMDIAGSGLDRSDHSAEERSDHPAEERSRYGNNVDVETRRGLDMPNLLHISLHDKEDYLVDTKLVETWNMKVGSLVEKVGSKIANSEAYTQWLEMLEK